MLAWIFLLVLADLAYGEKKILLEKPDSTKQWHWRVVTNGVGSGFTHPSDDKQYYSVCDVLTTKKPENWLVLDFVEAKDAKRVFIQLFYTMRSCPAKKSEYCKTEFYLYAHHSKKRDDLIDPMKTSFTNLSTISPASLIDNKMYDFTYSVAVKQMGVYFAIFDTGFCFVIRRVVISYNFCAAKEQGKLVTFPGTVAPFNDSQPAYVEGTCLDKNSVNTTRLIAMCTSSGQWNTSGNVDCLCKPGYGIATDAKGNDKCEACSSNKYKSLTANTVCQPCPPNSSPPSDKTSCLCKVGFYKLPQDAIKSCEGLPSAVAKIDVLHSNSTAITLHWPKKSKVWYNVSCFWCDEEGECLAPCKDAKYVPGLDNIKGDRVTVGGLEPSTLYQFKVYSVNELNKLADKKEWKFKSVKQKTKAVEPTGGTGSTSSPLRGPLKNLVYYGVPAVGAILIIVFVVLVFVYRRRRSKDGYVPPGEFEMTNGRIRLPSRGQRLYIDPSTYDNPEDALKTFEKELDAKMIKLEKVIGGGEFGDVYKGVLNRPQEGPVPVAVKALKAGHSSKNRQEFLAEASIMGQFCDPNVIFLEGVVTKHPPLMIVIEFMANGSLEKFLKDKDGQLTVQQLLGMARGVASGMRYLSEMNFVHRDLAARNVLVTETLVCKVADFGLSRELEDSAYETQGGKVPIRWTAPEAIEYRKFSTASDVWSYGIVLWEIMSFAERPYWDWGNFQVMDRVRQGYRLPAPVKCPQIIHDIMRDCWNENPKKRPKFLEIVKKLDVLIRSPDKLNDNLPMTQRLLSIDYTESTSIEEWLENIKMERYKNNFAEAGYKRVGDVTKLEESDLRKLGINLIGHKNKIRKSIKEVGRKIGRESTLSV